MDDAVFFDSDPLPPGEMLWLRPAPIPQAVTIDRYDARSNDLSDAHGVAQGLPIGQPSIPVRLADGPDLEARMERQPPALEISGIQARPAQPFGYALGSRRRARRGARRAWRQILAGGSFIE